VRVRIATFKGAMPKMSERLLGVENAQAAVNCRLDSGALRAWNAPLEVATGPWKVGVKRSLYHWKNLWFHWLTDVDVVRSPIATNITDRVIFTGDGKPKITDDSIASAGTLFPAAAYDLGIPAPISTPSVTVGPEPGEPDEALKRARNYLFTYVSDWGEEGPPSDASTTVEVYDGQLVTVGGLAPLAGSYAGPGSKRLYRANSGSASTEFQFVVELPMAQTSYADTVPGEDLAEALQSLNFDPPPEDLAGLSVMPNGMLVGFSGNDLCFSEPYQPHAWPTDYRLHTDHPIVALGVMGQSVLVATTDDAYMAQGVDPAAMSLRKVGAQQACVSKRSLVEVLGTVVYASPDGLVMGTEAGLQVATEPMISREQWQAYSPSSMHGVYHEGRYYAFYDTGAEQGCLILDASGVGLVTSPIHADAATVDPEDDTLYLLKGDALTAWDRAEGSLTYRWRSKVFDAPRPINFSFVQVEADAYPLTLRVYGDGALRFVRVVGSARPVRAPAGFLARSWEIELEGSARVHAATLAESIEELRAG
jgi:hypothetical protein